MKGRHKVGLIVTFVSISTVVASFAFGDAESDRRGYLNDIDSALSSAASELSGVESDSDDGDIRDAESYVDKVRDLVSRLDSVKGDDSRAKEVVDRYPRYIENFKRASTALRTMKGIQRSAQPAIRACEDKDKEFLAQAQVFLDKNDPDGLDRIPRLASDYKNAALRILEDADRLDRQLDEQKRAVQYFDASDGKWDALRSQLRTESEAIHRSWQNDRRKAEEACRNLKAGADHPAVKDILGRLASSAAGRKEVIANLERLIGEMASRIKDVPGASSASSVDSIRERLDAIDNALQILDRTKGADFKAKEYADRWPSIAREARAALEPLKELKENHHALDELPARCKEIDAMLERYISSNGDDVDGIEKIPAYATELGNPVIAGLTKAKERLDKQRSARDNVQRFSRSEGWSDVTAAYKTTSDSLFGFFEAKFRETEAACEYIVKRSEHPKVKAAVERLRGLNGSAAERLARRSAELRTKWANMQSVYATFEKDFWAFLNESARIREFDADQLTQLVTFICGQDHERDGDEADRLSREMGDKLVRAAQRENDWFTATSADIGRRLPALYADLRDLNEEVDAAVKEFETVKKLDKGTVDSLRSIAAEIKNLREAKRSTFFGLYSSGVSSYSNAVKEVQKGQNNPRSAAASQYGRDQHKELGRDSRFECAETEFSAGGGRADCVSHKQCLVWEFKPDSYSMSQAVDQAQGYVDDVNRKFPKSDSAGKAWEQCWKSDGPSRGRGYEPKGFLYPKCDGRK